MHFMKGLEPYFISTGFIDLLPLALKLAGQAGYSKDEIIEAICKVADKHKEYPPRKTKQRGLHMFSKKSYLKQGLIC